MTVIGASRERGAAGPALADVALVALGGAIGTLARVAVSALIGETGAWPLGTLGVNLAGAFLLGLLLGALPVGPLGGRAERTRLLVGTGMLGGFTTYSLLAAQLAERLLAGAVWVALGYAAATLLGGLIASGLGIWAGRGVRAFTGGAGGAGGSAGPAASAGTASDPAPRGVE